MITHNLPPLPVGYHQTPTRSLVHEVLEFAKVVRGMPLVAEHSQWKRVEEAISNLALAGVREPESQGWDSTT